MNFSSELLSLYGKSPAFRIVIEGKDVTTVLDNRLMGVTLTDNRGFEADQLDLELDDADGQIVLPRRGAVIQFALGWEGQPLFHKGLFTLMKFNTAARRIASRFAPAVLISGQP